MYELKKADLESTNLLKQLMIDTFKQAYEDMHTKENIEEYCNKNFIDKSVEDILSSDLFTCTIAFNVDFPVGFLILKDEECPARIDGSSLELQQLYILKSEYKKGLGKQLFKNMIKISKSKSKQYIWLYVSDTNKRAVSFYNSIGFRKIGTGKDISVGTDNLTSSVMVYKI